MKTMKIMICYDGSELGDKAIDKTIELFKPLKPEIILLTVAEEPLDASSVHEDIAEEVRSQARDVMMKAAEGISGHALEVDAMLAVGRPKDMIISAIDKKKPDIVVVTRQRKSALTKHFISSVSGHLVRNAACHLLIYGPDAL